MMILSLALLASLAKTDIKNTIVDEATRQGLEPQIALAVATVESGLNPLAVGSQGEIGLFQLNPRFVPAIFNTQKNIELGVSQLVYWKQNCPTQKGFTWVTCYNQGARNPRYPELLPYYKKVMKALANQ